MKKMRLFILAVVLMLTIIGCGKKTSDNDWTNIIVPISWDMTKSDVISAVGTPSDTKTLSNSSTVIYEGKMVGDYTGTLIYGFDENDNLRFLKFIFDDESDYNSYIEAFTDKYGKPDKTKRNFYSWYGNVNDEDATFIYEEGVGMIEVDKN